MSEETPSPISAAKPPIANPITPAGGGEAATLKLKPVLRKPGHEPAALKLPVTPVVRKHPEAQESAPAPAAMAPAAPELPRALDQLKSVTQRLKGVTQEIPQQAILRKTGVIAQQELTEAQKQAAKARTARISLSDALGAAPVKESSGPMKTIRIKRPVDIPGAAPAAHATPPPQSAATAPAPAPAPADDSSVTVTQRKTLKISRPGGMGKPTLKFGVKKPGATVMTKSPTPPAAASPAAEPGDIPDIADIPDMSAAAPAPFAAVAPSGEKDVPVAVGVISLVVQVAACAVMGFLAWLIYRDTLTL